MSQEIRMLENKNKEVSGMLTGMVEQEQQLIKKVSTLEQ